ncbi:transcriptional repressor general negative regulator of transcription subunit 4 [Dispira simplex]|nr:transcriptional repressor general negative regulator of transcription subunit 4 [Dispira simplex]
MSDNEDWDCPLCLEEMDLSDRSFKPCPCGYQICRFCWHHIKETLNNRCPACRRAYSEQNIQFTPVSTEELMRLKQEKKARDREKKEQESASRRQLQNMRVIQKNLVYVIGLTPRLASEEVLRQHEYFGQFGKITKVVINKRTNQPSSSTHHGPSYGVYITYSRKDDATKAIAAVDGSVSDGKTLRATYGTTKYCTYYLRHIPCQNPNCMYLHEPGEDADSYTKEDLASGKHHARDQPPPPVSSPQPPATKVQPHVLGKAPTLTSPTLFPALGQRSESEVSAHSGTSSSTVPTNVAHTTDTKEKSKVKETGGRAKSPHPEGSALPATASWAKISTGKATVRISPFAEERERSGQHKLVDKSAKNRGRGSSSLVSTSSLARGLKSEGKLSIKLSTKLSSKSTPKGTPKRSNLDTTTVSTASEPENQPQKSPTVEPSSTEAAPTKAVTPIATNIDDTVTQPRALSPLLLADEHHPLQPVPTYSGSFNPFGRNIMERISTTGDGYPNESPAKRGTRGLSVHTSSGTAPPGHDSAFDPFRFPLGSPTLDDTAGTLPPVPPKSSLDTILPNLNLNDSLLSPRLVDNAGMSSLRYSVTQSSPLPADLFAMTAPIRRMSAATQEPTDAISALSSAHSPSQEDRSAMNALFSKLKLSSFHQNHAPSFASPLDSNTGLSSNGDSSHLGMTSSLSRKTSLLAGAVGNTGLVAPPGLSRSSSQAEIPTRSLDTLSSKFNSPLTGNTEGVFGNSGDVNTLGSHSVLGRNPTGGLTGTSLSSGLLGEPTSLSTGDTMTSRLGRATGNQPGGSISQERPTQLSDLLARLTMQHAQNQKMTEGLGNQTLGGLPLSSDAAIESVDKLLINATTGTSSSGLGDNQSSALSSTVPYTMSPQNDPAIMSVRGATAGRSLPRQSLLGSVQDQREQQGSVSLLVSSTGNSQGRSRFFNPDTKAIPSGSSPEGMSSAVVSGAVSGLTYSSGDQMTQSIANESVIFTEANANTPKEALSQSVLGRVLEKSNMATPSDSAIDNRSATKEEQSLQSGRNLLDTLFKNAGLALPTPDLTRNQGNTNPMVASSTTALDQHGLNVSHVLGVNGQLNTVPMNGDRSQHLGGGPMGLPGQGLSFPSQGNNGFTDINGGGMGIFHNLNSLVSPPTGQAPVGFNDLVNNRGPELGGGQMGSMHSGNPGMNIGMNLGPQLNMNSFSGNPNGQGFGLGPHPHHHHHALPPHLHHPGHPQQGMFVPQDPRPHALHTSMGPWMNGGPGLASLSGPPPMSSPTGVLSPVGYSAASQNPTTGAMYPQSMGLPPFTHGLFGEQPTMSLNSQSNGNHTFSQH